MGIFRKKDDISVQIAGKLADVYEEYLLCKNYLSKARDASTINDCIVNWTLFQDSASELERIYTNNVCPPAATVYIDDIRKYTDTNWFYQKCLRAAIEHQIVVSKKAVQDHLQNSIGGRVNLYLDTAKEFSDNKDEYSEETLDFAQRMLDKLYIAIGTDNISRQIIIPEWKVTPLEEVSKMTIESVDRMNGTEFELFCAELLKNNGFTDVELTPKTGDQGVDLVAIKDSIRYAVQCKCYYSDLSNTPVQEVYAGKEMYGCHVGVVMTNRYFTKGAQELAERTHVLLWNRDTIASMMR